MKTTMRISVSPFAWGRVALLAALVHLAAPAAVQAAPPALYNTQLANTVGNQTGLTFTADGKIVVVIREAWQGGVDLNGDGDATDFVPQILDPATGVVTNLGPLAPLVGGQGMHAFWAEPLGNGLVAIHDAVQVAGAARKFWVYDRAAGTLEQKSGALNAWAPLHNPSYQGYFSFFSNTPDPLRHYAWSSAFIDPPISGNAQGVAGLVDFGPYQGSVAHAFGQGGVAINPNIPAGFTTADPVYGVRTHVTDPSGSPTIGKVPPGSVVASIPGPDGFSVVVQDTSKKVYVVAPDGTITDLGGPYTSFILPTPSGGLLLIDDAQPRIFRVWNGSTTSPVFSTLPKPSYSGNTASGNLANGRNAGTPLLVLANGGLVIRGDERVDFMNADLNGDGVIATHPYSGVKQVWDPDTNQWYNTGFRDDGRYRGLELASGEIVFPVYEEAHLPDLDGDGNKTKRVMVAWDQSTRTLISTGIASRNLAQANVNRPDSPRQTIAWDDFELPTHAFLAAFEGDHGHGVNQDLNGDGDQADLVVHSWNKADGLHNYGLSIAPNASGDRQYSAFDLRTRAHHLVVDLSEVHSGGTDLNGDGDALDTNVLHVVLPPVANEPPTADAGSDQSIRAGDTVVLDGSASFDDNTATAALVYAWSFVPPLPEGSTATLTGADSATPSFVADVEGTYVVQLIVTDEGGLASAADEVEISSDNLPPTSAAGEDQLVILGDTVDLDGSGSTDPENDLLTFAWQITSAPAGSTATLGGDDTATPSLVPDLEGVYEVTLTVSDFIGPGTPDTVAITVASAAAFAEIQIVSASDSITSLTAGQVTTGGNQNALGNFLTQAIVALQADPPDIAEAINKLEKAIARTDGCVLRGSPDGSGSGRDWITDCAAQVDAYYALNAALDGLMPTP